MNHKDIVQKVNEFCDGGFTFVDWFKDDGIVCVTIESDGKEIDVMHVGADKLGALQYAHDSETAKRDCIQMFLNMFEIGQLFIEGDFREEDPEAFVEDHADSISLINAMGISVDDYFNSNIYWGCFQGIG